MMELLLAVLIVALAAAGLGLGVAMGRGPVKTGCTAAMNDPADRCAHCPLRRAAFEKADP